METAVVIVDVLLCACAIADWHDGHRTRRATLVVVAHVSLLLVRLIYGQHLAVLAA